MRTIVSSASGFALALFLPQAAVSATISLPSSLVDPGVQVELLATGIQFGEGPAISPDGTFYFVQSNIPCISMIRAGSNVVQTFQNPSNKANGMIFRPDGSLVVCEQGRIARIDTATRQSVNLITDYTGHALDLCNDLTITGNGTIYFTNPNWNTPITQNNDVYMLSPRGTLTQLSRNMAQPNGVEYVAELNGLYLNIFGQNKVVRYALTGDGALGAAKDFAAVNQPDGLELDSKGNVYVASYGDARIVVFDSTGVSLGSISLRETGEDFNVTNCSFGWGTDTYLYITATTRLFRVKMKVEGRKRSPAAAAFEGSRLRSAPQNGSTIPYGRHFCRWRAFSALTASILDPQGRFVYRGSRPEVPGIYIMETSPLPSKEEAQR